MSPTRTEGFISKLDMEMLNSTPVSTTDIAGKALLGEVERLRAANLQQIKDGAEVMLALLEDRPIGGEYIHAVHCNADRREPVGNGMCSCRIGKRIKQISRASDEIGRTAAKQHNEINDLRAKLAEARAGLRDALDLAGQYGPEPSHKGPCGPEAGCDGGCQDAAHFGEQWSRLLALLPSDAAMGQAGKGEK